MLTLDAQIIANENKYPIIITRIAQKNDGKPYEYVINYVSDQKYCDWKLYFDLAKALGKKHGGKYILKHVKKPDGSFATIADGNKIIAEKQ